MNSCSMLSTFILVNNNSIHLVERETGIISNWMIVALIIIFTFFAILRFFFNNYIIQITQALLNNNTSSRLYREFLQNRRYEHYIPDIIFTLSGALFAYQAFYFFDVKFPIDGLLLYCTLSIIIICFLLIKNSLIRIIGILFNVYNEVNEYIFNSRLLVKFYGFLLVLVTLMFSVGNKLVQEIAVFLGIFGLLTIYISVFYKAAYLMNKKHFSIYYLILYLCTLEILPLLWVLDLVMGMKV